ncbi:hypothetical protein F442_21138 [Phytophthora nicotianae P10297]|uniref:FAR1 domain-containing protein n=4 Tax=Phytophthora nicotianae TaxID=4792 RepID=V9DZQ1_PHYNI|nr:hypothetical protein F443_21305 [Phytophthora nicotianae P1569]ETK72135.1 hypothetical protein L915_20715 [Phytophthora nicotianae]ETM32069.1 hypothetical protein L914_20457 [Phytophthora nicotianae]ETO60489.1 hypothetical protein F444_21322 [Phytophthora nicotianae P1976]ETP29747.1 hypothetical protein F442_21138 [Phytophthora nicotianae P10297]
MEPRCSTPPAHSSSVPDSTPDEQPVEDSVQLMLIADVATGLTTGSLVSAPSSFFKRKPIKLSDSEGLQRAMPFNAQSGPMGATLHEASAYTQSKPSIMLAPLLSGVGSTESPILESSIASMQIEPSTNATVPTKYQLKPPPEEEYSSEADASAAIHAWTARHGCNVTKKQLERNTNGDVIYRLFACDQWGKPKNTRSLRDQDRVRANRRSCRFGCPMRIKIVAVDGTNSTGP